MATLSNIIHSHIDITKMTLLTKNTNIFTDLWLNGLKKGTMNELIIPQLNNIVLILCYQYITYIYNKTIHFTKKLTTANKFEWITHHILNNNFLPHETKNEFMILFSKIQRTYRALSKLVYLYKFKRSKIIIKTDLYLNEIDPRKKNVITIYQNNSRYLFIISDLINIINNNLSNSPYFFMESKVSKNPYNNVEFSHVILYNIYFFIRHSNISVPELFHKYFMVNFNIKKFEYDNEGLIRTIAIKKHVTTASYTTLYSDIKPMLLKCDESTKYLSIHKDFPKEKLVNILRPYLQLYYSYKYEISGTMKKSKALRTLYKKMDLFVRFNILFGRKNIKLVQNINSSTANLQVNKNYSRIITFNDKHINFYKKYAPNEIPEISQQTEDDYYDIPQFENNIYDVNYIHNPQETIDLVHIFQIVGRRYDDV